MGVFSNHWVKASSCSAKIGWCPASSTMNSSVFIGLRPTWFKRLSFIVSEWNNDESSTRAATFWYYQSSVKSVSLENDLKNLRTAIKKDIRIITEIKEFLWDLFWPTVNNLNNLWSGVSISHLCQARKIDLKVGLKKLLVKAAFYWS